MYRCAAIIFLIGTASISQLSLRPVLGLTVSDLLYLVALCVEICAALKNDSLLLGSIPRHVWLGALIFTGGALVATTQAVNPLGSVGSILRVAYVTLVWLWMALNVASPGMVIYIAWAWCVSAAINGLAASAQLFAWTVPGVMDPVNGRMTGFTQHVNDLGGTSTVAIPVAMYFALTEKSHSRRVIALVLLVSSVAGTILSGSVAAILAALVGIAFILQKTKGGRHTVVGLLLVMLVLSLVTEWQRQAEAPSIGERIQSVLGDRDSPTATFWWRIDNYAIAWTDIRRTGFLGTGLDEAGARSADGQMIHNVFLGALVQAGPLGLIGVVLLLTSGFTRSRGAEPITIRIAYQAAMMTALTFSLGNPVLYQRYAWLGWVMTLATEEIARRQVNSAKMRSHEIAWRLPAMADNSRPLTTARPWSKSLQN